MKRSLLWFLILVPMLSVQLHAENVTVTSTLSKRTVSVSEEINLTIRITGTSGNTQAPRLPAFKGFETYYTGRSSRITFINGAQAASIEFSYILVPQAAGKYTLDPIEVNVNGQSFKTSPIDIEVLASQGQMTRPSAPVPPSPPIPSAPQPQQPAGPVVQEPPPSFKPEDDNIFVKADVDKLTVYPNEQVLLTYSLYTRYDTRYEGFSEEPEMSGFWIEEFPMEKDVQRETVRMNGKRYVKADVRRIALFPQTPAEYTIKPGTMKASIRQEPQSDSVFDDFFNDSFFSGSGFFSRRENRILKPPAIHLVVKPFPEAGKPSNFQGAVGNFRMSSAVNKNTVKQNEPVTMTIVIEGEGNIETLKMPNLPELDDFKIYEADTSSELFKTGYQIGGRKTFEVVFIPTKAGAMTVPTLSFSFFDPRRQAYQTLFTNESPLQVEPSDQVFKMPEELNKQDIYKKDIQVEDKDIRYIWDKLPPETAKRNFMYFYYFLAGLDVVLALLIMAGLWKNRSEALFARDKSLKRRKFARQWAESRISKIGKLRKANDSAMVLEFFEEIDKIITQYLSDKFNLSAFGTTRRDLESMLDEKLGSEDPLHKKILELYRLCDESRFGRGDIPTHTKDEAIKTLRETIRRVEKVKR